jgi:hypothetical protein
LRRPTAWLCALAATLGGAAAAPDDPAIAGWGERIRLMPSGIELEAKLDSGAENSSLHVDRLRFFERDDKRWVRFTVEGDSGRRVAFERRLLRRAAIKRHSGRSDVRPVVAMAICLGSVARLVEVNLVDRSRFEYPILVGRSFLAGEYLIDASDSGLQPLDCPSEVPK